VCVCVWNLCVCMCGVGVCVCDVCMCANPRAYACVKSELFSSIFFPNHYNKLTSHSGASPNYFSDKGMFMLVKTVLGQNFVEEEKKNRTFIRLQNTLYYFFWVIPRSLKFISRRFGALCVFHLYRWCYQEEPFNNCYGFQKIEVQVVL